MNLRNKIYAFWGIMDLLALASYLFFSLQANRVPFYSDIIGFYDNYSNVGVSGPMGAIVQTLFIINIALIVSLAFSAWCFGVKKEMPTFFFIGQEIARLLSLKCSIAVIPLILHFTGNNTAWGAVALFMMSEAIKIASVVWAKRHHASQQKPLPLG